MIASAWSSSVSKPYSSAYFALTVRQGSLPGFRAATKPHPSLHASAPPVMNPRASAHRGRRESSLSARRRSWPRRRVSHIAPEEQLRKLLRELRQTLQVLHPRRATFGIARAQRRSDELVEQRRLPVCGGAERAEMAGIDAESLQLHAGGRNVRVGVSVQLLSALGARDQQSEVLELLRELRRRAGALAQLVEVDLVLGQGEPGRTPALAILAVRRRQLLPDDSQRQELVALKPQDRLEPLDVVLAEEAVPPTCSARREQPLVLEVPNLRDRDVRELGEQTAADRADRE